MRENSIFMRYIDNYSLLGHNTFGMDVHAAAFFEYDSTESLRTFVQSPQFTPYQSCHLAIGAGSNLLFGGDYNGLLIHSAIRDCEVVDDDGYRVLLRVGSGCVWDDVVARCVSEGWGGAENLTAIPGEMGAAAVQNIGAYGQEICNLIASVETVDVNGESRIFTNKECCYGYRDSIFKNELKGLYFVTYVTLSLQRTPVLHLDYGPLRETLKAEILGHEPTLADVRRMIAEIRASKLPDPAVTGNAGSFFKNPVISLDHYCHLKDVWPSIPCYPVDDTHVKVPAAWLIEMCGWKGRSLGRAAVHEHQSLVLVNLGGANGQEVMDLARHITEDVKRKYGIELSPEVNFIV